MSLTRFSLAGLAVALVGTSAKEALADDLTLSTARTTPVLTSDANNSSAGDVTVTSSGSITVTAGQAAITVDSPNDVLLQGAINTNNADDVVGIAINGGFAGPLTVNSTGQISLLEEHTRTDTDSDGDGDGPFALGDNRFGIRLLAGAAYNGDITNTGAISVEGNASGGIRLDAQLNGDLTLNTGSNIVVTGDNSTGVAILGGAGAGVTGDVNLTSSVQVRGANSVGLLVDAPITGDLNILGSWQTSGYAFITRPFDVSDLDADDRLQSGSAVHIRGSVGGGLTIVGIGVEDDEDDDGDGDTVEDGDTNDNATAAIRTFGEAPALHIQSNGAVLALGATASGYGLHSRGLIEAFGVYDGVEATALRIEGALGAGVTTAGGIALDNQINASAVEASAYAVVIGDYVSIPEILQRGNVGVAVRSDDPLSAFGVYIGAEANAPLLNNTGTITATLFGEEGDAIAIIDFSDTLTTINNTGAIVAQIAATDENFTDGIPPPPITGRAIAIDLSGNTVGVTLNQLEDVPFTDDDSEDDDAEARPETRIVGDVLLGSGADTVNLFEGSITGALAFGDGADEFNIDNGAIYTGRLTDSDSQLTIDVQDGELNLSGGVSNITTATFGADSVLGLQLSATLAESAAIVASGDITFDAGAVLRPLVPEGLPVSGSRTIVTANGVLNGAANVTGVVAGAGTPYLYNLEIVVNGVDPNALDAVFTIKTANQLGLDQNEAAALMPIIDALRNSTEASNALAALDSADTFFDAYEDLMPSYSSAAAELAATAIQQSQSASTNRLATTRLQGLNETSVWGQEIAYSLTRTPQSFGQAYDGHGFGFAVGIDGPLDNGAIFGLAASFVTSEVEEKGRPDGEIAASLGQLSAYLGTALGPIDLDFVAGFGGGQMRSRRFVEIGAGFEAMAEAEWWAYEGHGAVRASAPMRLADWMVVTPQAALTYVALNEEGYSEEGGGVINYDVDSAFSQRLWGDVGVEFAGRLNLRAGGTVMPRLFIGYRANLIDEGAEREFTALGGAGTSFTLQDEPYGDGAPIVGIGIDATNGYSTFTLGYEGEFGDQIDRHSLNASVRFRF